MALLVPEATRIISIGLVGALTDHYRCQFENTVRQDGEDPSSLETLAVMAFGDMGPNARTRIICDWFIAGHPNSALLRQCAA